VCRYCNWLISEALEPVLTFLKVRASHCSSVAAVLVQARLASSKSHCIFVKKFILTFC
jgi:LDH2 family malate/lactate/ureidoglycolate dehydrogenase